jgi:FkbM family methyltransferase
MKQFIKKIFRYIPIAFTKNQRYDMLTRRVIRKVCAPDTNCIDVGCHKGEIMDLMLEYAPAGVHYGFEPIPDLYEYLDKKYGDVPNCIISDLALSNSAGSTAFNYVVSNPSYSGIRKRKYDRPIEDDIQITVTIDRMDHVLDPTYDPGLIKIDVEGAELQVLEGASLTLDRYHPVIIFEFGLGASDVYGTTPEKLWKFLTDKGYHIYLLDKWLANQPPLSFEELKRQYEERINHYFMAVHTK